MESRARIRFTLKRDHPVKPNKHLRFEALESRLAPANLFVSAAALTVKDAAGNEYNKWTFAADYASGKNFIGGGGFGMYYFFTKDISLLTGPVWFNDHVINGQWKWTVQLDINF